ncbi:protease secretion system membrane fusion protein [Sphaerotilus hippei]|uniref:Membrane fusion protein (MFP) family protein n=1 Tax=Sphaerotilus hippei TaxID=744406 RepID=A0A318GXN2_9BURK|nr:HlyD family type I secretion periplasmic adaptor subunit [Sphaerotilus hippei]PXW94005.1 protease secretion system membrane fusion protein [Sphaerotilus hippei]
MSLARPLPETPLPPDAAANEPTLAPTPAEASTPPVPPSPQARADRLSRHGLQALGLGLLLMLGWVAFAPLDEGVPTQGFVTVDTKRKAVQHQAGGLIRSVLVKEGDSVREGQPLFRLDDEEARAGHEAVRQRYLGLRAMEARLVAERDGQSTLRWHPDLQSALSDPVVQTHTLAQEQLFSARRSALQADLQGIEESKQAQKVSLDAYAQMQASRRNQLALVRDELTHTRAMVQEGYAPRNRQLELERTVDELNAGLADLGGNIGRTQRSIAELSQKAIQRRSEQRAEISSQLADVYRELQADAQKLRSTRDELARMEIRSPATGQVVGLAVQTVGAVIQPAQKLMDIVPAGEQLVLEARVPPHLIDRIKVDMPVDVRFSAFAHTPQLVVDARLGSISADAITDPQTNVTYYLARVAVTPEGMKTLGRREMQPGMPAELVIKTGERSLLTYFLQPLTRRVSAAMTEE